MNEDHKKWLMYLQENGIKFEVWSIVNDKWICGSQSLCFSSVQDLCRIAAQPIPDIPGWRELCREMQSKDVLFAYKNPDGIWVKSYFHEFAANEVSDRYQIPHQPIPEWREEMNQKELYIQYLEDALNHAKTGEPMKRWQMKCNDGTWENLSRYLYVSMDEYIELRIKPEPFKWTAYACRYYINSTRHVYFDTVKGHHVSAEDLQRRFPDANIIAVHHHGVNVDD